MSHSPSPPDPHGPNQTKSKSRLIAENNIVTDAGTTGNTQPVVYSNCDSAKFFNNQNQAGVLERGYNTTTGLFKNELEDAVQDVLLPF